MSSDFKFGTYKNIAWNEPFASVRFTPDQLDELTAIAQRIAAWCGDGYEVRGVSKGSNQAFVTSSGRGRVSVVTVTGKAMRTEAREHRLARYGSAGG